MPLRTPFHDFHVKAGAKLVDFAGWEMPLVYRSINDEHLHTRNSGSLFDVSHMGRLRFAGSDAQAFVDRVFSRKIEDQKIGVSRYGMICNERGGVKDDVIVSRETAHWSMVCNASNRQKLLDHFASVQSDHGFDVMIEDRTLDTAMIAVQGPKVIEKLDEIMPVDLAGMKRFHFVSDTFMMIPFTVARSGYTGEDGVELTLSKKAAGMAIKLLAGKTDRESSTIRPAGLGARDTLRLEAAMALYGHELDEETDPLTSGVDWAVHLDKDFIGADAIRKIREAGLKRKTVGLELDGRRIARQGARIVDAGGREIGIVTSGTFGPTVQKSIAMARVDVEHAESGTTLGVDFKGRRVDAKVVDLPFYKRK